MAAIVKLPSGSWRSQVRGKSKYVTANGHKDWKILRRYTVLRPLSLHGMGNAVDYQKAWLMPEVLREMTTKEKSAQLPSASLDRVPSSGVTRWSKPLAERVRHGV